MDGAEKIRMPLGQKIRILRVDVGDKERGKEEIAGRGPFAQRGQKRIAPLKEVLIYSQLSGNEYIAPWH